KSTLTHITVPVLVLVLVLVSLWTSCSSLTLPLDCSDIYHHDNRQPSGVYTIYPIGATSASQVYCDMDSEGGRWTVFQRRMDGTVNFYRPWDQYKAGFGSAAGEYWLGLDTLFLLTLRKKYELLVDMESFHGAKVYARYSSFSIEPESQGFKLKVSGFTDGGAGDALTYHNGQNFTTFDKDQDSAEKNCARLHLGAFWYKDCNQANPNGAYRWGHAPFLQHVGVLWTPWKGKHYSLKSIAMKIRPVQ
uniref:Microfibril-associated glycoprotein 4-like n=1 Tax=Echeneis naucrates TaxID=173247 RepID=A0A665VJU4_ECHNA